MSAPEFAKLRYPHRLALRVPAGVSDAIQTAATRNHTSPAEWARQALIRELAREGLTLAPLSFMRNPRCRRPQ